MDHGGSVTFSSRPVPPDILRLASPVVKGLEEFKINLFVRSEDNQDLGFMALRRRQAKGSIILALDEKGLKQRSLRFSLQSAMARIAEDPDIAYVIMVDQRGEIFGLQHNLSDQQKKSSQLGASSKAQP